VVASVNDQHAHAGFISSAVPRTADYYFWFELIPLNVLFIYLIARQEKMAESLEQLLVARDST